jgi:hypothetical protein
MIWCPSSVQYRSAAALPTSRILSPLLMTFSGWVWSRALSVFLYPGRVGDASLVCVPVADSLGSCRGVGGGLILAR